MLGTSVGARLAAALAAFTAAAQVPARAGKSIGLMIPPLWPKFGYHPNATPAGLLGTTKRKGGSAARDKRAAVKARNRRKHKAHA